MIKDTSRGNTIKLEEFQKLPDDFICSGLHSDTPDGIHIDGTGILLMYVVCKYSNQDWAIFCMKYDTVKGMYREEAYNHIIRYGHKVQSKTHIKRVFNCSKMVMDLYTH